jgi:hypothetical protein
LPLRNKRFAELCGIFWHEPKTQRNINLGWKCSCGEHNCRFVNPDYISDPRLVLREMKKQPMDTRHLFYAKLIYRGNEVDAIDDDGTIPRLYMTDTTGLLLDKAIAFMERRK